MILNVRRIAQVFFLILFIGFCVISTSGTNVWELRGWPVNWFLQLDPLVAVGVFLGSGVLYAGLIWALLSVALTLLFGRFFCGWVCPFGTLQRLSGLIGGAGSNIPGWLVRWTEVLRNLTVFAVVFLVFLTGKPGSASYEPFGVIFELKGTSLQWLLLFIVLSASLAIKIPWCRFFCPVQTCASVIRAFIKKETGQGKARAGINFSKGDLIPILFILSAFALIAGILIQGFS